MASEGAPLEGSTSVEPLQPARTIALQVLSPSLNPPNRITFESLPLTITVADLKSRIAERIPDRPSADKQRLIYRGKPLSDDHAVLQDILESSEVSPFSCGLCIASNCELIISSQGCNSFNTSCPSPDRY